MRRVLDVKPCVAVVGAGLIGRSWAIIFAGGGCDVALYDVSSRLFRLDRIAGQP
ncbi:MAG: hypothetical protein E6G79_14505 [Alphaproteobacteria bacterium]|nr:MAG: hypothetical protein E6G79_14505 [Alphaproteobacteria bacterium]